MTGWRIDEGAGPKALIEGMAAVQGHAASCPSAVGKAAAIAALTGPRDCARTFTRAFEQRRYLVTQGRNAIPVITCAPPTDALYAYASCKGVLGSRTPEGKVIETDWNFADFLLSAGAAVVPGACFGLAPHFRISFAASEAGLSEAIRRIGIACSALSGVAAQ
jgi:aspartate aminotransferase